MGNVTKNFSRWEWACQCGCGFDQLAQPTIDLIQKIRDVSGEKLTITSGCRCPEHNAYVFGAKNSLHLPDKDGFGWALDFRYSRGGSGWRRSNQRTMELYVYADQCGAGGIGLYHGRIHIDQRQRRKPRRSRTRWLDSSWNWADT
jgi:uncharacterized protein YcbK (DUF882 family)